MIAAVVASGRGTAGAPRRVFAWPLATLALWLVLLAAADLGSPALAAIVLPPFALLLVGAPAVVYPAMRRRGAPGRVALGSALLVPVVWIVKECWLVGRLYSAGEGLYYALNPIALGIVAAAIVQTSLAEIVVRRLEVGRFRCGGWPLAGLGVVATAGVATGLASRAGGPTVVYWSYVGMHRWLFGG